MNRKIVVGLVTGALLMVSAIALADTPQAQVQEPKVAQAEAVEVRKAAARSTDAEPVRERAAIGKETESADTKAAQSKSLAEASAKLAAARKEMLKAQLDAGLITQEQYKAILKQLEARVAQVQKLRGENLRSLPAQGGRMATKSQQAWRGRQRQTHPGFFGRTRSGMVGGAMQSPRQGMMGGAMWSPRGGMVGGSMQAPRSGMFGSMRMMQRQHRRW